MKFTTRLLLTCAAIGAAGGLLLIPANNIGAGISKAFPLAYAVESGVWLLPFVIALALLRRPGVAVLSSFIAGLINVPFTPYGFTAVVTCVMIGVVLEIPFAIGLYRHWNAWIFYVGTAVFEVLYSFTAMNSLGVDQWAFWLQALFVALLVASGLFFTWLGRLIAARVERTGVTRGLSRPWPTKKSAPSADAEVAAV
ncbi:hypothetical protein ASF62_05810 [Leifsonia sp. Leaf325]|nr:ECF transporter S component [Leifsonia sp. Leaf325]KQQ93720.1 hypothetical protein ASF62_05810 [Leifsonia sp. Leaf325]